jgi:cell division protein FtsB
MVRKVSVGVVLAAAGAFAYVHLRGPYGIPSLLDKREKIQLLESEIEQLRRDNDRRRRRIQDLTTGDGIESAIREKTGKIRPNEKRLHFPPEEAGANQPR